MKNPYIPFAVQITEIITENEAKDLKTFKMAFLNKDDEKEFSYMPGQFAQVSVPGVGEAPLGIASSPTEKGIISFTVKRAGVVTTRLHQSEPGMKIGVRGPYGQAFPWNKMESRNIIIVGGGFAFTTLRSAIKYVLHDGNRSKFGKLVVVYGARTPGELMYKQELQEWQGRKDMETCVTVDKGDADWKGKEGVVPKVLQDVLLRGTSPGPKNSVALVCGPPVMIKFTLPVMDELGFPPEDTYLSLEMRMKCGIGKCGRCNIGHKYVCKDGPVFSREELQSLPAEY